MFNEGITSDNLSFRFSTASNADDMLTILQRFNEEATSRELSIVDISFLPQHETGNILVVGSFKPV